MPGRMGNETISCMNKRIFKIDVPRGLIYVIGGVPGPKGSICRLRDANKKTKFNLPLINFPTFIK